jgi:hypothetical protein
MIALRGQRVVVVGGTSGMGLGAPQAALVRALAVDLGPLRVNTIRPGVIDSDMWSLLDPEVTGGEQLVDAF